MAPVLGSSRYALLLILFVLVVFYPAIFCGVSTIDDYKQLGILESQTEISLFNLFRPSGTYYRPLTILTFYIDKILWGLSPDFMHMENVVLHAGNTLLVFGVMLKLVETKAVRGLIAFLGALLFAVHPITAESVTWISGRTDLLAMLFVLLALLVMVTGIQQDKPFLLALSIGFVLIGAMAKETAIFFIPCACLIGWNYPLRNDTLSVKIRRLITLMFPAVIIGCSYLVLRLPAIRSGSDGSSIWNKIASNNFTDVTRIFLKLLGFYTKKLIYPYPLNFSIIQISPWYLAAGIIVVFFLIVGYRKARVPTVWFVVAAIMLVPSLLVVFAHVTWTPVAERYLYSSLPFFAIGLLTTVISTVSTDKFTQWVAPGMLILSIPVSISTAYRTALWQDEVALFRDVLDKSPGFERIRNDLAIALNNRGENRSAESELIKTIARQRDNDLPLINLAMLRLKEMRLDEARWLIISSYRDKETANVDLLKSLNLINEKRLLYSRHSMDAVCRELLDTNEVLYRRTADPAFIYRAGQMALHLKDKSTALRCFRIAAEKGPTGMFYKEAASKLADRLAPK